MGLLQSKQMTGQSTGAPTFNDDFSGGANTQQGGWENIMAGNPEKSKAMQRAQMYQRKGWAPDNTIDQSIWDQINPPAADIGGTPMSAQLRAGAAPTTPNTPGSTPPPQSNIPPQQSGGGQQSGQQGGNIWDKLSGGAGKAWEGIKKWDKEFTQRSQDRGFMEKPPEEPEKPWSISDVPDEQWHNRKMGIMFDPNDPELSNKMMQASMHEGRLNPERYQQISRYQADVTDNPYYQSQRDKHYEYGNYGANKFDAWLGKKLGYGDKNIDLRGN